MSGIILSFVAAFPGGAPVVGADDAAFSGAPIMSTAFGG
jgi:hypothetical protein